jgi:hypothetical protein
MKLLLALSHLLLQPNTYVKSNSIGRTLNIEIPHWPNEFCVKSNPIGYSFKPADPKLTVTEYLGCSLLALSPE